MRVGAACLRNLDDNVAIVKSHYNGRVMVANDLDCMIINQ